MTNHDDADDQALTWLDEDRLHEECGVFGIFGHPDAAALTALGLHALQHRGQEAAGIVSFDGAHFHTERRLGLVGDHFTASQVIERLKGDAAIGHVRYSTCGDPIMRNVQPLFVDLASGGFALSHNGNLTNALTLRDWLITKGAICQSTTDTEVILHLVARSEKRLFVEKFIEALLQVEGAYALVGLTNKKLVGARDPFGIRPLVLGKLGEAWVLASETCALDIIGADFVREIENGEVVVITKDGIESHRFVPKYPARLCIFEYIYFARPELHRRRPLRLRCAQRDGPAIGAGSPGQRRRGHPHSRFRRAGCHRLFARLRHPLRIRHHPQPLCRTHLHRAGAAHPSARREAQA